MPGYTESFDRNTGLSVLGGSRYNPSRTEYYGSDGKILRVEESFGGVTYGQTISGTGYAQYWPTYSGTIVYSSWEEVTVS